jgi:hypothetical protein
VAGVTPNELLESIIAACEQSAVVAAYTVRVLDLDVLSVRVYLLDESFIEVFHNVTTGKAAFALIAEGKRIYGKDNAKMGWHVHPSDNPEAHYTCAPVSFETFLNEVESLRLHSRHP